MNNKNTVTALIITKNEGSIICDCLDSIDWVDEIVVVDSGSTDNTVEQVEKCQQSKVYTSDVVNNFSAWRNLAAEKATSEWLFYIDADERCTPDLAAEIQTVIKIHNTKYNIQDTPSSFVAYDIPRANIRLTKPLYHGGWWPDYVLRLMKKDSLVKWEGELHEQPVIKGKIGRLKNNFIHLSHRGSLEHKFKTTIKWSKIESDKLFAANHPPMNLPRFMSAMGREFWKRMIRYQGWRDGLEGIMEVIYQEFSVFITYARLWELQQRIKNNVPKKQI